MWGLTESLVTWCSNNHTQLSCFSFVVDCITSTTNLTVKKLKIQTSESITHTFNPDSAKDPNRDQPNWLGVLVIAVERWYMASKSVYSKSNTLTWTSTDYERKVNTKTSIVSSCPTTELLQSLSDRCNTIKILGHRLLSNNNFPNQWLVKATVVHNYHGSLSQIKRQIFVVSVGCVTRQLLVKCVFVIPNFIVLSGLQLLRPFSFRSKTFVGFSFSNVKLYSPSLNLSWNKLL